MSRSPVLCSEGASIARINADGGGGFQSHIESLLAEKEDLGRELLRRHEQLNLVFEITEHISNLQDPDTVETALLRHYGTVLGASAVFLDRAGCCMRVEPDASSPPAPAVGTHRVRAALAAQIEDARHGRRACTPAMSPAARTALADAHVLLGSFHRADADISVVIALRDQDQPPFDAGDILAADSVLAYGAQVLNNVLMLQHLRRSALETVCTLVNAIDAKDNYTSDHSERVGGFARLTGEALGLPKSHLQALEWAGLLHDVGKIGISEYVLNKPGPLTPAEFDEMKRHPQIGHDVLKPVAQFDGVSETVLYHHENHDGSGYPRSLVGDAVPLDARIIHVVDIFDALTTSRPYRSKYGIERAFHMLDAGAGRITDPDITRLFVETLQRYRTEEPARFLALFGHLREPDASSEQPS